MLPCSPSNDIRRKMKIKSVISLAALIASSFVFISVAPANAGDCSTEDPCQTYAVVDGSGVVTNVIICQPSVCGSGEFGGNRVVLQVPASAGSTNTHGGPAYNSNKNEIVTENNGVFSITPRTTEVVETTVEKQDNVEAKITTVIEGEPTKVFTANDFMTKPENPITELPYSISTDASVSIEEVNTDTNQTISTTVVFESRVTSAQADSQIQADTSKTEEEVLVIMRWGKVWKKMLSSWLL